MPLVSTPIEEPTLCSITNPLKSGSVLGFIMLEGLVKAVSIITNANLNKVNNGKILTIEFN